MDLKSIGIGVLLTLVIFFGGALGFAWFDGQQFTQQQVDNVNAETVSLDCTRAGNLVQEFSGIPFFVQKVNCFELVKLGDNIFEARFLPLEYHKRYSAIQECLDEFGFDYCNAGVNARFRNQHETETDSIREQIVEYQNPIDISGFDPNDWGLTDEDLN